MLLHFLKISFRRLFLDRTFSFVNLFGLTIGISAVFLLAKFIGFHLTADNFHTNSADIFAIYQKEGQKTESDLTYTEVAPIAKDQLPEVIAMSRYIRTGETLITTKDDKGQFTKFNERNVIEVDPGFLQMFTFEFIRGNSKTALDEPNTIVITQSIAKKYFGDTNPIGQTLNAKKTWGPKRYLKVTGVIQDFPSNSQFQFDFLQTLVGKKFNKTENGWTYANTKSYLLLDHNRDVSSLAKKLTHIIKNQTVLKARNQKIDLSLVSFSKERSLTNDQQLLIIVGIFLLIVTWINYTNLSGAKAITRGKEFGIRKVMGSNKPQLVKQFIYEALLIYSIAMMIAIVLIIVIHPVLKDLVSDQILPILEFDTPINLIFISVLFLGALTSATYPTLTLNSFTLATLLKGTRSGKSHSHGFQKTLITFQFTVSIIMLISLTIIYKQMQFMKQQEVGFNIDQILVIKAPKDQWAGKIRRIKNFKDKLKKETFSNAVTASSTVPLWWPGSSTNYNTALKQEPIRLVSLAIDSEYFNCFGMSIIAGENFKNGHSEFNQKSILINELTALAMGYTNPEEALHQKLINKKTNSELEIIGIVKNHHHESLRREIKPQVFEYNSTSGFISINMAITNQETFNNLSNEIARIENIWNQIYPDQAFDYYFLNERFNTIYQKETTFQYIFLIFTTISLVITFLGIFGLSIFISTRRKKEIGIRKSLGALPLQIHLLFYNEFIKKVLIAFVVGIPIALYIQKLWLSNFSYQISLNMWLFIFPCLILIVLTFISLSFESFKLVKVKPVEILREE